MTHDKIIRSQVPWHALRLDPWCPLNTKCPSLSLPQAAAVGHCLKQPRNPTQGCFFSDHQPYPMSRISQLTIHTSIAFLRQEHPTTTAHKQIQKNLAGFQSKASAPQFLLQVCFFQENWPASHPARDVEEVLRANITVTPGLDTVATNPRKHPASKHLPSTGPHTQNAVQMFILSLSSDVNQPAFHLSWFFSAVLVVSCFSPAYTKSAAPPIARTKIADIKSKHTL